MPVAAFNAASPATVDRFGSAVGLSGSRLVVGAPNDDTAGRSAGSAYVYDLASGAPATPVAMFANPSPSGTFSFGKAAAISGTRIVIGSPYDNTGATNAGRAFVYDLASATPTVPIAALNNPSPAAYDYFGDQVAISGTLVVIGTYRGTGTSFDGSAYVFDLAGPTPTTPKVTLDNPNPGAGLFGSSVAIFGTRLVVGAPGDSTGAAYAGRAYFYDLAGATPAVPTVTLNNPSPASGDEFGTAVAIYGTRVLVGVPFDDTGAVDAGAAYLFDLAATTPTIPVAILNSPNPEAGARFGSAVAISGTRAIVAAANDDAGGTDSGRAFVYDFGSATPAIPVATLNNPSPAATDFFGFSLAFDGVNAIVGAYNDDSAGPDRGAAYLFGPADLDGDGLLDAWELLWWPTTAGHNAGDDFDRDGLTELQELAFGLNPTLADSALQPSVIDEGGYLTITITKHAGVTYEVQSAGTVATGQPASFSPATTTVLLDNGTTLKVRDNVPIGTSPARFMRVKVTSAP